MSAKTEPGSERAPLSAGEGVAVAAVWVGALALQAYFLSPFFFLDLDAEGGGGALLVLLLVFSPTLVGLHMSKYIVRRGAGD